jgi:hypothetical protein
MDKDTDCKTIVKERIGTAKERAVGSSQLA